MKKTTSIIILLFFYGWLEAGAGESFFGFDRVQFFTAPQQEETTQETQLVEESIFAEPIVGPDGKTRIYVPPRQVLEFLNSPTKENARGYLEWNQEKINKITQAQQVLQDVVAEENQKRDKKEAENKSGGKEISSNAVSVAKKTTETTTTRPNVSKKEISVALTPDCKYCNAQLFVLEAFKKKYPFLDMKIVWFGEKDKVPSTTIPVFLGREEDKKKIRKFPTFFFTLTNGEVVAGEGFVDGKNLELFCKKVGVL